MPFSLQTIEEKLKENFPDAIIVLQDYKHDGVHLLLEITSEKFRGITLVKQHRLVYDALNDYLKSGDVHALKIKTLTPSI